MDPSEKARLIEIYADPKTKPTELVRVQRLLMLNGVKWEELPPIPETPTKPSRKTCPPIQGNPTRAAEARAREEQAPKRRAIMQCLEEIEAEDYEWLWPGRIPLRTVSMFAGDGGAGKSTLTGALAATVTTGGCWPDRPHERIERGRVVILSAEENPATDIRPRYDKFGADCKMVHILKGIDAGRDVEERFSLSRDIPILAEAVADLGNVRLLMIDPVGAYLNGSDSHNDAEVQEALTPLFRLAEDHHLAVVLISHLTKQSSADIQARIQGAAAFVNKSRMVWFFSPDPRNQARRLMSFIKGNPVDKIITGLSVGFTGGQLAWDPDPVNMSAKQVNRKLFDQLARGEDGARGPKPEKTKAIATMIEARLKASDRVKLSDIIDEAKDDFNASRSTVNRVIQRMNGHIQELNGDDQTKWLKWRPDLGLNGDHGKDSK